jgi:hypothetical protein
MSKLKSHWQKIPEPSYLAQIAAVVGFTLLYVAPAAEYAKVAYYDVSKANEDHAVNLAQNIGTACLARKIDLEPDDKKWIAFGRNCQIAFTNALRNNGFLSHSVVKLNFRDDGRSGWGVESNMLEQAANIILTEHVEKAVPAILANPAGEEFLVLQERMNLAARNAATTIRTAVPQLR